ncbi:MAG: SGNH/GDSL hydrolase family protein [Sulfitobacter sp.]
MEDETTTQPNYNALFVFGDSLSDNGAIFALTGGTIPPAQMTGVDLNGDPVDFDALGITYEGVFSNGPVYADVAAGLLGIPSDTSTFYDDLSGSNVAVGGATATDLSVLGGTASNTYADQINAFQQVLSGLPGTDEEKSAFLGDAAASVFIGLNDLGALGGAATATGTIDQSVIETGVTAIVEQLFTQSQTLAETGVGTIILNKLPGGSFFPNSNPLIDFFGPETAGLFDAVSASVNDGIDALAATLSAQGTKVEVVDFFNLAQEVQADAETFGFLTLENALPGSNAVNTLLIDDVPIKQIGFIDPVHFTAELHEVFGAFQATTLGNTQNDGTADSDLIGGSEAHETIFAMDGNDQVRSGDGDDLIFAGAGDDVIFAGAGNDIAFGGTGNDLILGQDGNDVLVGGTGTDVLYAGDGNDVVAGSVGNDFVNGGAGDDLLIDGRGNDVVSAGSGDDTAIYRAAGDIGGTDGEDSDFFFGGDGTDTLIILSEMEITDTDAFLESNNVQVFGFENIITLDAAGLESYDFGIVGLQNEMADLFGLI